jgi:transmembrane sensor
MLLRGQPVKPHDATTRQAIDWVVLFGSGDATVADQQRFDAWVAMDPGHLSAWERVSRALNDTLAPLRPDSRHGETSVQALRQALIKAPSRRRFLRGSLAVAGIGVGGGLVLTANRWMDRWGASLATDTGERRRFALPDGSSVLLNARSRAVPHITATSRALDIERGAALVDATSWHAPFLVRSAGTRVVSHGGQFMVQREDARSLVAAIRQPLVATAPNGHAITLQPGSSAWLGEGGVDPADNDASALAAWQRGVLEVGNQSLGQVIDALRPYRSGLVRVDPLAARLRVMGLFPLDDTERALDMLAATLPIRVERYSRWLTLVEPRDESDRA